METSRSAAGVAVHSLLTLLADGGGRTAAISLLHQRALQVSGGSVSLLFEPHPASGRMQATSGAGVDSLPTVPWEPARGEAAIVARAFGERGAVAVTDVAGQMPALHAQVGTAGAVLVPLVADSRRIGLLAVGLAAGVPQAVTALNASDVPPGFLVALELSRLRQRNEFEQDVRTLLDTFAERLSSALDLAEALGPLCVAVTRLFGADRTTVWLYEREQRALVALASSDPVLLAERASVRADDPVEPAAVALRSQRAGLATGEFDATSLLSIPLRGCRRALGTVVCEGVRIEPGDDIALLTRADELGRQLSSAVETVQLLDAVMRSRQELEQLFASIVDLIVVVDSDGLIVRANRSFASAAQTEVDHLVRQPLSAWVGPELTTWLASLEQTLDGPAVGELTDAVLGGPYAVTVTDLPAPPGRPSARVIVASDLLPVLAQRSIPEV